MGGAAAEHAANCQAQARLLVATSKPDVLVKELNKSLSASVRYLSLPGLCM